MAPTRTTWGALAALLLAGAVTGCGGTAARRDDGGEPAIVDLTNPVQPLPPERFSQPDPARIAPGDLVEIRGLGFPELSGQFLVSQDGRLNLHLIGSLQAAGKSAEELDRDLTAAFGTYYRNLDIAVNVVSRAERDVYVLGEVVRAGRYDFRTGERVLHAVADAGGMKSGARQSSIVLLRRETDGDHAYRLDFSQIHGPLAPKDIYLQPGDVVFVPKSRYKTVYEFASDFLDVLGRAATTTLVIEYLNERTRNLTIAR